jgi:hypothetical protein
MFRRRPVFIAALVLAAVSIACGRSAPQSTPEQPVPAQPAPAQTTGKPVPPKTTTPPPAPAAIAVQLKLTGEAKQYSLHWNDGGHETLTGSQPLPWTHDNPSARPSFRVFIEAEGSPASFSCTITINGKVVAQKSGNGSVYCEAFTPSA